MATKPGFLTDWPWKKLGSFKYVLLAPWVVHSLYSYVVKDQNQRDLTYVLIFPFMLLRIAHNLIWISYSRYRTAKGTNRILDKGIEFEQVDRESSWDDQILLNILLYYITYNLTSMSCHLPWWRTDGIILTILLHAGPVEFLYYWLHRALHHHYLYSRYHSHHHSSIVTEPITSVIHPFAEHIAYFTLFAIPLVTALVTRTGSIASFVGYVSYIDLMNNMGHCNFELVPDSLYSNFPLLKYIMYSPTFHSLHHTQFRTNYSLFMPFYDYLYGTVDKNSDTLFKASGQRADELPDVVHLVHLTTPESIYHLQVGFACFASKPLSSKWYFRILWPATLLWSQMSTRTFISERNVFNTVKSQTWVVPRYKIQYSLKSQREVINGMIEEAIKEADKKGVKVLTLGLLNQDEELNKNGEAYVKRNPYLKVKVVDGSSLAVAVILNHIPHGTTQVLIRGNLTKVAYALALALCQRGIQITTVNKDEEDKLRKRVISACPDSENMIIHSPNPAKVNNCSKEEVIIEEKERQIWLVGEEVSKEEQMEASKGTIFIPYSQFPPKKWRKDCVYYSTPAMIVPQTFENIHSCENWLPRRVMSAWRIAGILHGLEGWNQNECSSNIFNLDQIWEASLRHGFRPYKNIT